MADLIHFSGRDLPVFGEYVRSGDLLIGEVYFRVGFLDDEMHVPELTPVVFIGRDLDPENLPSNSHQLFFQDYGSYARGVRWGMKHPPVDAESESERFEQFMSRGWFESGEETEISNVFVFEKALDVLLRCSISRRNCGI
jgi:hypothetical protein